MNTRLKEVEGNSSSSSSGIEVPIGGVLLWTNNSVLPQHFMLCEGQAISRTTYKSLYDIIGTGYGAGDGSTTFNIPDIRNRFPIGGKVASSDVIAFGVGQTGGSKAQTLTKANLPEGITGSFKIADNVATNGASAQQITGATGVFSSKSNTNNRVHVSQTNVTNATTINEVDFNLGGSGSAIDILPPYLSFKFIIRVD